MRISAVCIHRVIVLTGRKMDISQQVTMGKSVVANSKTAENDFITRISGRSGPSNKFIFY